MTHLRPSTRSKRPPCDLALGRRNHVWLGTETQRGFATRHQVTEIPAQGEPFDPNVHQALTREEREGIDLPQVIEVYQKGFRYLDKLLRPALTKVAVPQAKDSRLPDTRPEA